MTMHNDAPTVAAPLSTTTPAEVGGLVAELRDEDFRHEMQHLRSSSEIDRLFQAAASLIQSQAARIAELEAGISEFADPTNWVVNGRFDPHSGNFDATTFARALLNKEVRG